MNNISIDGFSINYMDTLGEKPVLLFIHGNSLSSKTFINQFSDEKLTDEYRLIAPDMLGYGGSERAKDPESEYAFHFQAELLVKFISELKLENVIMVGHSLGGNIAIEVAKQSKIVKGIALLASPVAEKPMSQEMFLPNAALPYFFTPELNSEAIDTLVKSMYKPSNEIPDWNFEIMAQSDPLTRAYLMAPVMAGNYEDQLISLKKLDLPIAVFIGADDQLINPEYVIRTKLPNLWNNNVNSIENGGHMFFYENSSSFNQKLLLFSSSL